MKRFKKLSLNSQTVHVLSSEQLGQVAGGAAANSGQRACQQNGNASGTCGSHTTDSMDQIMNPAIFKAQYGG
jgi:natural product precursor